MLLYHNRSVLRLIFARHGSIIRLRSVALSFVIAAITFGLVYLIDIESDFAPKLPHHYGIMLIGSVVSFALVYRMNLGWQRYWEAIAQQHFMYSKWADAYAQFFAFCQVSIVSAEKKGGSDNQKKVSRINEALTRVERNMGLLSAMTAHRLTCGDNERMERRTRDGAKWADRVVLRQKLRTGKDLTGATTLPELADYNMDDSGGAVSRPTITQNLEQNWDFIYRIKELPTLDELHFLAETKDRVSAVMYWILHDLSQISADLIIAPPIQSRMYQELSNGMLGFNNSLKIADVPFPFPYAQLLTWMLIAFSALLPVYIGAFTQSLIMSPVAAFFACLGIWSVNEVAIELENPFGGDSNDISCGDFHERFLDILIEQRGAHIEKVKAEELLAQENPASKCDHLMVPHMSVTSSSAPPPKFEAASMRNAEVLEPSKPVIIGSPANVSPVADIVEIPSVPKLATPIPNDGALDVSSRLVEVSNAIERRLTEILTELKVGCNSRASGNRLASLAATKSSGDFKHHVFRQVNMPSMPVASDDPSQSLEQGLKLGAS